MTDDAVGTEAMYDVFADSFAEHAADGFYNAYYDRPACLSLLGDVRGKVVLDAACGPGLYAAELAARGARVTGFDISPRMIEICRARVGEEGSEFRVCALGDRLDWLADGSVDLVLCALALEHVDERVAALRELRRVLRPDGALVLSLTHPTGNWLRHGGSYFDRRVIRETWSRDWQVSYWIAPLEAICADFRAAGFLIERLLEPRPVPAAAELSPADYEQLTREPRGFVAFRLVPAPSLAAGQSQPSPADGDRSHELPSG